MSYKIVVLDKNENHPLSEVTISLIECDSGKDFVVANFIFRSAVLLEPGGKTYKCNGNIINAFEKYYTIIKDCFTQYPLCESQFIYDIWSNKLT